MRKYDSLVRGEAHEEELNIELKYYLNRLKEGEKVGTIEIWYMNDSIINHTPRRAKEIIVMLAERYLMALKAIAGGPIGEPSWVGEVIKADEEYEKGKERC